MITELTWRPPVSEKGKKVLDHFSEYLPKFKKVIPNDYKHDAEYDRAHGGKGL